MSFTHVISSAIRQVETFTVNTSGANFLVLVRASSAAMPAPVDSRGNTWQLAGSFGSSDQNSVITVHYADAASTGVDHNFAIGNGFTGAALLAFQRTAGTLVVGPQAGRSLASATSVTAGGITPTVSPSLVIAALGLPGAAGTVAIGEGFSTPAFADAVSGSSYGAATAWLLQATAAAVDPTWTLGTARPSSAALASFAVSTGSPPPPSPPSEPTITTLPLRNESNTLLPNTAIANVLALRMSDGVERARWANVVTDAQGVLTLANANLTAVPHLVVTYSADGAARGIGLYTPVVP